MVDYSKWDNLDLEDDDDDDTPPERLKGQPRVRYVAFFYVKNAT